MEYSFHRKLLPLKIGKKTGLYARPFSFAYPIVELDGVELASPEKINPYALW